MSQAIVSGYRHGVTEAGADRGGVDVEERGIVLERAGCQRFLEGKRLVWRGGVEGCFCVCVGV